MGRLFYFSAFAALLLLTSCGENSEQVDRGADSSDAMFMAEIGRIYGFKCAICHGKKGRSVIKTAPHLTESTMSFNERVAIIKYGKTTMPPQKDVLDVKTIEGLAKYIESFKE